MAAGLCHALVVITTHPSSAAANLDSRERGRGRPCVGTNLPLVFPPAALVQTATWLTHMKTTQREWAWAVLFCVWGGVLAGCVQWGRGMECECDPHVWTRLPHTKAPGARAHASAPSPSTGESSPLGGVRVL